MFRLYHKIWLRTKKREKSDFNRIIFACVIDKNQVITIKRNSNRTIKLQYQNAIDFRRFILLYQRWYVLK